MTDLEQKIKNLSDSEKESLLALLNKVTSDEEPEIWVPEDGEPYFLLNSSMEVRHHTQHWSTFDRGHKNGGNCYKTEELAERAAERRRRTGIFENKMLEFSQGYGFKRDMHNYYLFYCSNTRRWKSSSHVSVITPLVIYMEIHQVEKAEEWANKHYPDGL